MKNVDLKFWLALGLAAYFFYKWNEACFLRGPLGQLTAADGGDARDWRSYTLPAEKPCACHARAAAQTNGRH